MSSNQLLTGNKKSLFKRENNTSFDVENITVGTGGKQVIIN
jgi:hypothetical protein